MNAFSTNYSRYRCSPGLQTPQNLNPKFFIMERLVVVLQTNGAFCLIRVSTESFSSIKDQLVIKLLLMFPALRS